MVSQIRNCEKTSNARPRADWLIASWDPVLTRIKLLVAPLYQGPLGRLRKILNDTGSPVRQVRKVRGVEMPTVTSCPASKKLAAKIARVNEFTKIASISTSTIDRTALQTGGDDMGTKQKFAKEFAPAKWAKAGKIQLRSQGASADSRRSLRQDYLI
jgi:hypothetical protein